jgi:hypothetical protein
METERNPRTKPETRRTPRSAAGCNKPARLSAEQTIKVVKNCEGGTGPVLWRRQANVQKRRRRQLLWR